MKMEINNLKRKLVIFKFTLVRGYAWCQLPAMATMGAGIVHPYVKQYIPWMQFWQLALLAIIAFIFIGWLDKKFELLHVEQAYTTETNPTLMKGLRGELNTKDIREEEHKPKDI